MTVTDFDEAQHPRDPSGQFTTKPASESHVDLSGHQMEPVDSIAAAVDELRGIDVDEAELFEAGIKPDSRAVQALSAQRQTIMGNLTSSSERIELDGDEVAGKVIAYAHDGTLLFTDGSWASATSPAPSTPLPATPGSDGPPSTDDPRVQAGEVLDTVQHEGWGTFHRRRDGVSAGAPYAMRFQANRRISDEEMQRTAQLVGYAYRANVRGEPIGEPERDSPYSFVVAADTTKSRSDDLGMAMEEFEETLPEMLVEGSPVRKTDRAGAGTAGTRLVDGLGEQAPTFEIYYDDVYESGPGD